MPFYKEFRKKTPQIMRAAPVAEPLAVVDDVGLARGAEGDVRGARDAEARA